MTPNVEFIDGEPLDAAEITNILRQLGGSWDELAVLATVDSTNTELARDISLVAPGSVRVLIAEEQTGGLGRLGRTWSTESGKGIALSIGVDVVEVRQEQTALPLIVGLAVIRALRALGVSVELKWPNDVIFQNSDGSVRKCGGILVQRIEHAFVIGIGINATHQTEELPTQLATSLRLEGFEVSRNELVARIIKEVETSLQHLDDWVPAYLSVCASIGREIVVTHINNQQLVGKAISVLPSGALLVSTDDAEVEVTIGDVVHATIN